MQELVRRRDEKSDIVQTIKEELGMRWIDATDKAKEIVRVHDDRTERAAERVFIAHD